MAGRIGLAMKSAAPFSSPVCSNWASAWLVTKITGMSESRGSCLIASSTSKPDMPGIWASSSTRSGGASAISRRASRPWVAKRSRPSGRMTRASV